MDLDDVKAHNEGCYFITHLKTGLFYVGSAMDCTTRIRYHFNRLKHSKHNNPTFQRLWDEQSVDEGDFVCWIRAFDNRDQAYDHEQFVIDQWWGDSRLINRSNDVRSPITGVGLKEAEHARATQSIRSKAKSIRHRDKISKKMKEVWDSDKRERRGGSNNPFARRISVDGVTYGSLKEAAAAVGVSDKTLMRKAKLDQHPNIYYPDKERVHHKTLLSQATDGSLYTRKIMVNWVNYPTIKLAKKATGCAWKTLVKRAHDPNYPGFSMDPDVMVAQGRDISYAEIVKLT